MDDYTNIERLAEVHRLEQGIREAQQRVRELKGDGSPNGKMGAREMPATVTLMNGSEIAPIAIRWIWKGWLAEGKRRSWPERSPPERPRSRLIWQPR